MRDYDHSSGMRYENVKKFLEALDALGMPGFEIADLEKVSIVFMTYYQLFIRITIHYVHKLVVVPLKSL